MKLRSRIVQPREDGPSGCREKRRRIHATVSAFTPTAGFRFLCALNANDNPIELHVNGCSVCKAEQTILAKLPACFEAVAPGKEYVGMWKKGDTLAANCTSILKT